MSRQLRRALFSELNINDPFFDSLKHGYAEFPEWFARKQAEGAELYCVEDDSTRLTGMVYLKVEVGPVNDTSPSLPDKKWLKIGTLKIDGRGTKLGERVIKKILDTAIDEDVDAIYVTVFQIHESLISLFSRYGFDHVADKNTANGIEMVLVRELRTHSNDLSRRYPFIQIETARIWLLAVYPEYHTRLLPDSILRNERQEIVKDVSYSNTIHKVYIGKLSLNRMSPGDIVVIYRTSDGQAPAYYRSVVTSLCVVEEVREKRNFVNFENFRDYVSTGTVFSEDELWDQWRTSPRLYVAKMTYNVAMGRRTTRGALLDGNIISEQPRWDLRELTHEQLRDITDLGRINERIIID
ncbi:hypothetical protein [Sulfitobacter faviae]|uniref:hypothetical protein n=1 Tax=Sulfitobacter faviae TaxID=1775881 RepID=UPI00398D1051